MGTFQWLWVLGALLCCTARGADFAELRPLELSLGVEPITAPSPDDGRREEKIGLGGAHVAFPFDNGWRAGVAAFFSVAGPRGGLILFGPEIGYRFTLIPHLYLQTDLFVGGGGGSRVPVGGGLMVRPAASLRYDVGPLFVGAGYAWVRFPDSPINHHHAYLELTVPSDLGLASEQSWTPNEIETVLTHWRVAAVSEGLFVSGKKDVLGKSVGDFAALAGIALDRQLDDTWFTTLRVQGAVTGELAGFLRLSLGLGYAWEPRPGIAISPILNFGVAGGAGLSTGGGAIAQPEVVLSLPVIDPFAVRIGGGYLVALDEDLRLPSVSLAVAAKFDGLGGSPTVRRQTIAKSPPYRRADWRVSLSSERYFLRGKAVSRAGRPLENIDLLGVGFEYRITPRLSFDFTSYWPYAGNAGGYAMGLLGLGFVPLAFDPITIELRLRAGAAGGGGIPAGGGLVGKLSAGLDAALGRGTSVFAQGGRLVFARGLAANFAEMGLRYAFGWPTPITSPAAL